MRLRTRKSSKRSEVPPSETKSWGIWWARLPTLGTVEPDGTNSEIPTESNLAVARSDRHASLLSIRRGGTIGPNLWSRLEELGMKAWRSMKVELAASMIIASHLVCGLAWAREGNARSEEAAKVLYEEGLDATRTEQWAKARKALATAFQLKRDYEIAGLLGWAEWMSGAPRDAAEHLAFFLREAKEIRPKERQEAETMLAHAKSKIGTVTIRVDAAGAELFLDGKRLGASPLATPLFVEPGNRKVEARKAGFRPVTLWVDVEPGSNPIVAIGLAKAKTPKPPDMPIPNKDKSESSARNTLIYAGLGVGAALAAVGIGTAIGTAVTAAERDDTWYENQCTSSNPSCLSDFDAMEKKRFYLANTAFWCFVGAAAVGSATGIFTLVTANHFKSARAPQTNVTLSVRGGGLALQGTF